MQEQIVQLFGEQGFLQRIRFRHGMLHDLFDSRITGHDLIGLCTGGIEGMRRLDPFDPFLRARRERIKIVRD